MPALPLAAQLYTVRDDCARDFEATLRAVARMGYRAVEFAGLHGLTPQATRGLAESLGLRGISSHFGFNRLETEPDTVIGEARALGIPLIACPSVPEDRRRDAAGWRHAARTLDAAGAKLRAAGLQLCYHNHSFEFEIFDGKPGLAHLYDTTSPENVHAELDVYWVRKGGDDPVKWIERLKGRCSALHLKDMSADGGFAEVGHGSIDFPAVLRAAEKSGVRAFIVEQDVCTRPPLESLAMSLEYLRKVAPFLV